MALKAYSVAFLRELISRLLVAIPVSTGKLPLDFSTTSGQRVLAVFRYRAPWMPMDALKQALILGTDEGVFFWTGSVLLSVDQRQRMIAEAKAKAEAAKIVRQDDRANTTANANVLSMARGGHDDTVLDQFASECQ